MAKQKNKHYFASSLTLALLLATKSLNLNTLQATDLNDSFLGFELIL